jgi:hypothetical protein
MLLYKLIFGVKASNKNNIVKESTGIVLIEVSLNLLVQFIQPHTI